MPSDRATLSEALATLVDVGDGTLDLIKTDGPSIIAKLDAIAAAYAGQRGDKMAAPNQSGQRLALRQAVRSYVEMMGIALNDLGKADTVDIPVDAPTGVYFRLLREWMSSANYYVTARGWTRGSEPSITGLSVYRLLTDRRGEPIESGNPEVITATVVKANGNAQTPLVEVSGEPAGLDAFELLGSGMDRAPLTPLSPDVVGDNLLINPTLAHSFADAADVTALSGWTLNASDEWVSDTDQLFRNLTTSIQTSTQNAYIEQFVTSSLNPDRPYLPVVAVRPSGAGSGGIVTINWGGKSQVFSSLTNNTWQLLAPDRDEDLWPLQFDDATNGARIRVTFSGSAGGSLNVAFVGWVPMTRLPNGQWWLTALQDTTPVVGASGTITDSLSAADTLNHYLPLLFPNEPEAYLKTTNDSGSTQIADLS